MKAWKAFLLALLVVAVIGIICGAVLIHRGFRATVEPSALEKAVARTARNLAIPGRARNEKNPLELTPENLREGREEFLARCASCHGHDGAGLTDMGRNLYPRAPDLRVESNAESHRRRDSLHHREWSAAYRNAGVEQSAPGAKRQTRGIWFSSSAACAR